MTDDNNITYDLYVEALDSITEDNYLMLCESSTGVLGKMSNFVKYVKSVFDFMSVASIIKAFKNSTVFQILKSVGFRIKRLITYINAGLSAFDRTTLKLIKKLEKDGKFKKLKSGAITADDFLKDHPALKRITGFAVAGILLMIWLNMTFSGNFHDDMDLTNLFAALAGNYSIYDIFANPTGIKMLLFFATGVASAGVLSFPWLVATERNLVVALCYTGMVHEADISKKSKNIIKKTILSKKIQRTGFSQHLGKDK